MNWSQLPKCLGSWELVEVVVSEYIRLEKVTWTHWGVGIPSEYLPSKNVLSWKLKALVCVCVWAHVVVIKQKSDSLKQNCGTMIHISLFFSLCCDVTWMAQKASQHHFCQSNDIRVNVQMSLRERLQAFLFHFFMPKQVSEKANLNFHIISFPGIIWNGILVSKATKGPYLLSTTFSWNVLVHTVTQVAGNTYSYILHNMCFKCYMNIHFCNFKKYNHKNW